MYSVLSRFLIILLVVCSSVRETSGQRRCVLRTAISQVGIRELTGKNDGEVEKYLRYVGLPKGNPYCAAFVCWTYAQECVDNPHTGYSPLLFPKNRITAMPEPADVFGIYFTSKGRIAHVGLVLSWGNQYVETIEANTNDELSRDGDGVYIKKRLKRQVYKVSNWID